MVAAWIKPIPPFKDFLWMIVIIMPFGPLLLELQGFYEHPLLKQYGTDPGPVDTRP